MLLYHTICQLIQTGHTDDLEKKIDIFYAAGKLSDDEYNQLIAMLHPGVPTESQD